MSMYSGWGRDNIKSLGLEKMLHVPERACAKMSQDVERLSYEQFEDQAFQPCPSYEREGMYRKEEENTSADHETAREVSSHWEKSDCRLEREVVHGYD
ncbi:hypothetical protein Tco_0289614 [Tanacetum coccineum]